MRAELHIRPDDLTGPEVIALLEKHLAYTHAVTPPESIHALDLSGLRVPEVTAWTAWRDGCLLGCGALKELDAGHGEVKSMHTAASARGEGVGTAILLHIVGVARDRGYARLSLETGAMEAFAPARALYRRHGFSPCGPFGDYGPDPNSAYMTLEL